MFLLAILALLQALFIPGFILVKACAVETENRLQKTIYIFALSLTFNYLAVYLFTVLGIFAPITVYLLMAVEILILVYFFKKSPRFELSIDRGNIYTTWVTFWRSVTPLYRLLLIAALSVIGLFGVFALMRLKEVFFLTDSVLAWNRFALYWYKSMLPEGTWRYPQLVSTNWAMIYQVMGTPDIQMVARNIMVFFPAGIVALFIDLGIRKRQSVYFCAAVCYGLILNYLYRPAFVTGGYADIGVSFFALLAFYVLYAPGGKDDTQYRLFNMKRALLAVVFASAAAVTKQIGLYILFYVLIWNLVLMIKSRGTLNRREVIRYCVLVFVLVSLIVGTWYVYKEIRIQLGYEASELGMLTGLQHMGRDYGQRILYGFKIIVEARGIPHIQYAVFGALFFMGLTFFEKRIRIITAAIILPLIILWAFMFSYDYRALMLPMPFMAMAVAYGVQTAFRFLRKRSGGTHHPTDPAGTVSPRPAPAGSLPVMKVPLWGLVVIIAVPALVLNFTLLKGEAILKNQLTQMRNVGDQRFNEKLYAYFDKVGYDPQKGNVYSTYHYFRFLPRFRDLWVPHRNHPGIRYIIDRLDRPNKAIKREIRAKIANGEYRVILKHNNYFFAKVETGNKSNSIGK